MGKSPAYRCCSCDYDLRGVATGAACPECGEPAHDAAAIPTLRNQSRWVRRVWMFGGLISAISTSVILSFSLAQALYRDDVWRARGVSYLFSVIFEIVSFGTPLASHVALACVSMSISRTSFLRTWLARVALMSVLVYAFLWGIVVFQNSRVFSLFSFETQSLLYTFNNQIASAILVLNWCVSPLVLLSLAMTAKHAPSKHLMSMSIAATLCFITTKFAPNVWQGTSRSLGPLDAVWVLALLIQIALGVVIWRLGVASLKRFDSAQR